MGNVVIVQVRTAGLFITQITRILNEINGGEQMKNKNVWLALGAMVVGILSIPVTALVNMFIGLAMMAIPLLMIYKAG